MKRFYFLLMLFTCLSLVTASCNKERHEYVDLGLPSGTLWATCNIGASSPEGAGDYFAWGETKSKEEFTGRTYKFYSNSNFRENGEPNNLKIAKYNTNKDFGKVDGKTSLDPEDDVAHALWGSKWSMPTDEEWTELREKCEWRKKGLDGNSFAGYEVIGPNGNSIFLPTAGYREGTKLESGGTHGCYWSSTLDSECTTCVFYLYFSLTEVSRYNHVNRPFGFSVRPVRRP